jgi:hypothetical protein
MMEMIKKLLEHFLAAPGVYEAGGLISWGHVILLGTTIFCVYKALNRTLMYSFVEIRHIIRVLSVLLCALECCKIAFHFAAGNGDDLNTWVPLYFCSIGMFAGLLSGFATGALQHIGDVFLATGGLIGGICFLLYPSSSLMIYPSYHFLSIHSFLYHGVLTYMGILINRSGLYQLKMDDLKVYAMYVLGFCALAWIINANKGTNLMFISETFRGTFLDLCWKVFGKLYTPMLIVIQMTVPFLVIAWFKDNTALLSRPTWYPAVSGTAVSSALTLKHYHSGNV